MIDFERKGDKVMAGFAFGPGAARLLLCSLAGLFVPRLVGAQPEFFDRLVVPQAAHAVQLEKSLMVRMRDGVQLSTDLYLPADVQGPLPVVMIRTPYNKNDYRAALTTQDKPITAGPISKTNPHWQAVFFAQHGYAVVVQDHRGRFESEGMFVPYPVTDGDDGYDTLSWIAKQSWSTGKVGTMGCSYVGETQHMLATRRHPNHTTAIAQAGSSSTGAGGIWNFGFTRYGVSEFAAMLSWNYWFPGHFTYGPPAGVDRQAWFRSDEARLFRTSPVMPDSPEKVRKALATLPAIQAMQVLGDGPVPSAFEDWMRYGGEPRHPYWSKQGLVTEADRFDTPTLHINSWYDTTPNSTLKLFGLFAENAESARARDHQYLVMGASTHCGFDYSTSNEIVGDRPVGDAHVNFPALYLAWFDHWLKAKDNGIEKMPKVSSYVLGRSLWRTEQRWPLQGAAPTRWYLDSEGQANSRQGNGRLRREVPGERFAADSYRYDPADPVPTVGGSICCTGTAVKEGGVDQREVELRKDVLVFTSEPLTKGIEVAGALEAVLHVSSSAKDTDFVAKLVDVYPDGTAYIVQEGIMRARWRNGLDQPVWMQPGEIYELRVDMEATHNYFAPGHRIRLDISSSSFPRWDRNLNTGGANFDESRYEVAQNTIHHSRKHASYLLLPVLRGR